jgi:hypothetical protein
MYSPQREGQGHEAHRAHHAGAGVDAREARGGGAGQCARQCGQEADGGHGDDGWIALVGGDSRVHRVCGPGAP